MKTPCNFVEIVGSVNGLICRSIERENLFIWNPSIRKFKILSDSKAIVSMCDSSFKYGFGDELDGDNKFGSTFVIYNPKDNLIRYPAVIGCDSLFDAKIYIESLVWPLSVEGSVDATTTKTDQVQLWSLFLNILVYSMDNAFFDFSGAEEKKWNVKSRNVASGEKEIYTCDFLVLATGENSEGYIPKVLGLENFKGEIIHSSEYKSGQKYEEKEVLVVGSGNSGMEIAFDLSNYGSHSSIVVRSPGGNSIFTDSSTIYGVHGLSAFFLSRFTELSSNAHCLINMEKALQEKSYIND
ncbi:hypothetical protein HAX54_032313 [Datura stramonium]|uniref:Flavin-containing monooxygenase n=1 Tax=Datura stramonium TaxID=4076 RepID=A0ABS8SDE3_DATST|nr:hypothetical protein [Datura stramonium]